MRTEVQGLDGDHVDKKLLLSQQLNHLDAPLMLLGRVLPTSSGPDMKPLPPDDLCEAGRHLNMAVHIMLALAPKFREATHQRLLRHLGCGHSSKFECCSRRRPAAELYPQKWKRRLLIEEDELLLPILEWHLGAAASDFAVARAVVDRLPGASARQTGKKNKSHSAPTATVGIRCESKASFIQSSIPGEAHFRFADCGQQSSPSLATSHLPTSPGAVVMKHRANDAPRGVLPKAVCPAIRPCLIAGRSSRIHTGRSSSLASARPNPRNSSPFPDLRALGPCHHCRSRSTSPNSENPLFQEYSCSFEDCSPQGMFALGTLNPSQRMSLLGDLLQVPTIGLDSSWLGVCSKARVFLKASLLVDSQLIALMNTSRAFKLFACKPEILIALRTRSVFDRSPLQFGRQLRGQHRKFFLRLLCH
ncbi:hypothetical protein Esti_001291 [Eimeria stiedai]